jgi:hypothetical protein
MIFPSFYLANLRHFFSKLFSRRGHRDHREDRAKKGKMNNGIVERWNNGQAVTFPHLDIPFPHFSIIPTFVTL